MKNSSMLLLINHRLNEITIPPTGTNPLSSQNATLKSLRFLSEI